MPANSGPSAGIQAPAAALNPRTSSAAVHHRRLFSPHGSPEQITDLPPDLRETGQEHRLLSLNEFARRAPAPSGPEAAIEQTVAPTQEHATANLDREVEPAQQDIAHLERDFEHPPMRQQGETGEQFGQRALGYLARIREENPRLQEALNSIETTTSNLKSNHPHVNNVWQITNRNVNTVLFQVMAREGFAHLTQGISLNWSNDLRTALSLASGSSIIALTLGETLARRLKQSDTPVSIVSDVAVAVMVAAPLYLAAHKGVAKNALEGLGKSHEYTAMRDLTAVFHTLSSNINSPRGILGRVSQMAMLGAVYGGMQGAMGALQGFKSSHSGTNTTYDDTQPPGKLAAAYLAYATTVLLPEIVYDIVDTYSDAFIHGAGDDPAHRQTGGAGMNAARVDAEWKLHTDGKSIPQRIAERFENQMISRLATFAGLFTADAALRADAAARGSSNKATDGSALGIESLFLGLAGTFHFKGRFDTTSSRRQAPGDVESAGPSTGERRPELGGHVDPSTTEAIDFATMPDAAMGQILQGQGITEENVRGFIAALPGNATPDEVDQAAIELRRLQSLDVGDGPSASDTPPPAAGQGATHGAEQGQHVGHFDDLYDVSDDEGRSAPRRGAGASASGAPAEASAAPASDSRDPPSTASTPTQRRPQAPATASSLNLGRLSGSSQDSRATGMSTRSRQSMDPNVGAEVDKIEDRVQRNRGGRGGGAS